MLSYKIIGLFSDNGKSIQIHHIFIGVNTFDKSAGNTDFKIMKSMAIRTFNLIYHLILLTNTMEQLFKHIVNYGSDNFWMIHGSFSIMLRIQMKGNSPSVDDEGRSHRL